MAHHQLVREWTRPRSLDLPRHGFIPEVVPINSVERDSFEPFNMLHPVTTEKFLSPTNVERVNGFPWLEHRYYPSAIRGIDDNLFTWYDSPNEDMSCPTRRYRSNIPEKEFGRKMHRPSRVYACMKRVHTPFEVSRWEFAYLNCATQYFIRFTLGDDTLVKALTQQSLTESEAYALQCINCFESEMTELAKDNKSRDLTYSTANAVDFHPYNNQFSLIRVICDI